MSSLPEDAFDDTTVDVAICTKTSALWLFSESKTDIEMIASVRR